MRRRLPLALVLALAAALLPAALGAPAAAQQALPCDDGGPGSYAKVSAPPRYDILRQEVVRIPSQLDGAMIQLGVVRPDVPAGTRVPVITLASVYLHPLQDLDLRVCAARLTENFVPQGYAVALVAVRGTADSGGCMDLFGPKERADLDQAITWLGTQSWSSGSVGMYGKSYDGGTPWEVAAFGNPHLKTIVPVSGVHDLFALLFGAGVPDWRGPTNVITDVYFAQSGAFYAPGRSVQSTAEVLACPEYADANIASVQSGRTGEHDTVGYWAARRYRRDLEENYRGSVLLVQGLQDWNVNPGLQYPWINDLVARTRALDGADASCDRPVRPYAAEPRCGIVVKHVLGQWGHVHPDQAGGSGRRNDWADVLLAWFDRWLKDRRDVDLGAVAEVHDSSGQWRRADAWPPPATPTALHLSPGGTLAPVPDDGETSVRLVADATHTEAGYTEVNGPAQLETDCEPPVCAAFATPALADELRFAGRPTVRLRVTPTGPEGQLSAYLYAVGPDRTRRLGWGQVDLRFPDGEVADAPRARPVAAGVAVDVALPVQPLDAVVPAGAQLVLLVSQGTAYNRLAGVNLPVDVAIGAGRSVLELPVVTPDAADFFTPPAA